MQCLCSDFFHEVISLIFQPFELLGVRNGYVCFNESVYWKVEAFPHFLQSSDNLSYEAFSNQFLWNGEIDVHAAIVEASHSKVLRHFLFECDHLPGNCVVSI